MIHPLLRAAVQPPAHRGWYTHALSISDNDNDTVTGDHTGRAESKLG